jgi:hypothetical protein
MMKATYPFCLGLLILAVFAARAVADDSRAAASDSSSEQYTLRYKFRPGETIRWEVLHQARVRSTVADTTRCSEMVTKSVKAWRVTDVEPDGTATFEHLVESVHMRNKFSDRGEVRYNSETDEEAPVGYEGVAESIGVPLTVAKMSPQGEILHRERKRVKAAAQNQEGLMSIPLPEEAVPVGHTWSLPYDIEVPLENGTVKKVKSLQTFTLESVRTGVATIRVATKILTPIHDPALEAKLIQREQSGTVRFDLDAGRVLSQQMDLDRRVVGFTPTSAASSLHYVTRFTETLLPDEPEIASRPEPPTAGKRN